MSDTQEKLEQRFLERILYIGNEIPESLVKDKRDKFILLGTPQDLINEAQALIDSAKREAISEYIEPHLRACRDYNGREWCKNCGLRPLQEQSGGSDDI